MSISKGRVVLSRALNGMGINHLLAALPASPGLLVLNHHRIGEAACCDFDRAVISASADELDQQIVFLQRRFPVVGMDEALHLLRHPARMKHPHILLTFDDGYRDNYDEAAPVLCARGCSAVFFIVPQMVGTAAVPWWDEIAFLLRNCPSPVLELDSPAPFRMELEPDREAAIAHTLIFFKSTANREPDRFLEKLRETVAIPLPKQPRRFMTWEEIRELAASGMEIGSHTASHAILGRLTPERQFQELVGSKQEIEAHTGTPVRTLAYPLGSRAAFSELTEQLALQAGYEAAFSFFSGINSPGNYRLTNLRRMPPWTLAHALFATEISLMTHFGPILSKLADRRSSQRNW